MFRPTPALWKSQPGEEDKHQTMTSVAIKGIRRGVLADLSKEDCLV